MGEKFESSSGSDSGEIETAESEKEERIKKIISLFERGMDTKDSVGYHGTSIESIEFLLENGHLPGGYDPEDGGNYLYFWPKKSKFEGNPLHDGLIEEKDALGMAEYYADELAKTHFLMKRFGLDMDDGKKTRMVRDLFSPVSHDEAYKSLLDLGIDKKELDFEIRQAEKRKGVVLSLNSNILESHSALPGDTEEDLRIAIPEGLKLDFISGLEPMGDKEWKYFENLQDKRSK